VTGVEGEHMTREQTLDGVEAIIGKGETADAKLGEYADKSPVAAAVADAAEAASQSTTTERKQ